MNYSNVNHTKVVISAIRLHKEDFVTLIWKNLSRARKKILSDMNEEHHVCL